MSPKIVKQDDPETVAAPAESAEQPSAAAVKTENVRDLAYKRWLERGCPQGSPDEDWFEAEHELQSPKHES